MVTWFVAIKLSFPSRLARFDRRRSNLVSEFKLGEPFDNFFSAVDNKELFLGPIQLPFCKASGLWRAMGRCIVYKLKSLSAVYTENLVRAAAEQIKKSVFEP